MAVCGPTHRLRYGRRTRAWLAGAALVAGGLALHVFLAEPAEARRQQPADSQATAQSAPGALRQGREAAERGVAAAQHDLGVMYAEGEGVAEDDHEAVRWFRKAAEQG